MGEPRGTDWKDRIAANPKVCHGTPCVKGTRISVSLLLDFLAAGDSIDEILRGYPQLTREDVLACVGYAAELARERIVPIPIS